MRRARVSAGLFRMHTKRAPARGAQSTHIPGSEQRLPTQLPGTPVEHRIAPKHWHFYAAIGKKLADSVVHNSMRARSCEAFSQWDAMKIERMRRISPAMCVVRTTNARQTSRFLRHIRREFRMTFGIGGDGGRCACCRLMCRPKELLRVAPGVVLRAAGVVEAECGDFAAREAANFDLGVSRANEVELLRRAE